MIAFLLTSVVLSCAGCTGYFLLMRRASARQQKACLYAVVCASLLLSAWAWWQMPSGDAASSPKPVPFGAGLLTARPSVARLQQLCQCPNPDYSHRVQYRTHIWLNFLLDRSHWLFLLLSGAAGMVLLTGVGEGWFLRRLVRRSRQETLVLGGTTYSLLHPPRPHGVGAFWLGKAWIIWQPELDALAPEDLHAILQHELSHLAQRHTAERFALRLLQCFWVLNPALYFLRRELNRIGECLADARGAAALGDPARYARLLVAFTERQTVAAVRAFRQKPLLYRRVAYLLAPRRLNLLVYGGYVVAILLTMYILCFPVYGRVTQGIAGIRAYHTLYVQHPGSEVLLYCPDCETVCEPE